MKKEYKKIIKICKELIGKESYKNLKKIEDYSQRTESLKYLIDSKLKLIILELEHKIQIVDKKDSLILESKLKRLASKIKIFHSTYSKRDYLVLNNLIKDIKEEMKNVGII